MQVFTALQLAGVTLLARIETAGIAVVADVVAADGAFVSAGRNADIGGADRAGFRAVAVGATAARTGAGALRTAGFTV